jgi:hypothetical protein
MAKNGKSSKSDLLGPMYTKPNGNDLGPHRVEGPKGGMTTPDPMGFGHGEMRHGPDGEQRSQTYSKD